MRLLLDDSFGAILVIVAAGVHADPFFAKANPMQLHGLFTLH